MPQTLAVEDLLVQAPGDKGVIRAALDEARQRTWMLAAAVPDAEWTRPACDYLSPVAWDLGHMANFEEQWLVQTLGSRGELRPGCNDVYNAFAHPRPERPTLPLMPRDDVRSYMDEVRRHALSILAEADLDASRLTQGGFVHWMLILHEHQHQETVLQTLQMRHATCQAPPGRDLPGPRARQAPWVDVPAGRWRIGAPPGPGIYDNESAQHEVALPAFRLARYPVTCGDYLAFVEQGGYDDDTWWGARGRQWLDSEPHHAPLYWSRRDGEWHRATLRGWQPVSAVHDEILCHVTWFEAQAYARWAGARLPSEAEWEAACLGRTEAEPAGRSAPPRAPSTPTARMGPPSGSSAATAPADPGATGQARWLRTPWGSPATPARANIDQLGLQPSRIGAYPDGAAACGAQHMIGDVWEWTSSGFEPYPRFEAFPYDEYSKVFFGGDYRVLRGGSWATRAACATGTFRNWDHPYRRQIFAGIRLARDP